MHINMKHWKLVNNDGKKATLRHSSGHTMELSVKGLHPANREELSKIPLYKGGIAKQSNPKLEESKKSPSEHKLVDDKHRLPPAPNSERAGPYGKELLADGGEVDKLEIEELPPEPKKVDFEPVSEGDVDAAGKPHYADGTGNVSPSDALPINTDSQGPMPSWMDRGANSSQGQTINYDSIPQDMPYSTPPSAPPIMVPSNPNLPAQADSVSSAPQSPQNLPQPADYAKQMQEATGQQLQGIQGQAKAEGHIAEAQRSAAASQADQQLDLAHHIDAVTAAHNAEIDSVIHDIKNQHIDPNHYMSSIGTAGKISTGIGLILGGIGSGLTHGPNMALDFLNKQIDRDIDGQKMEMDKKQNLVGLYSKMLGNERDGAIMASQVMARVTADKLTAAAAASGDPMAKARAQQAAGALLASRAPEMQRLNMTQGLINASKSGTANPEQTLSYMRVVNPEMAKEMESRYVPQLGFASVPITPADRTELATKATGLNMARDLRSWAQQNAGALNPATINEGKAKATAMLNYYRTATDQGVIKPSELEFDSKIVDSDPTKFFNKFRTDPKYKVLEDSMTKDLNTKRQQYGLPQEKNTSNQSANPHEGRVMGMKDGSRAKVVNGKLQKI